MRPVLRSGSTSVSLVYLETFAAGEVKFSWPADSKCNMNLVILIQSIPDLKEKSSEITFGERYAINTNAFSYSDQVRRCI